MIIFYGKHLAHTMTVHGNTQFIQYTKTIYENISVKCFYLWQLFSMYGNLV